MSDLVLSVVLFPFFVLPVVVLYLLPVYVIISIVVSFLRPSQVANGRATDTEANS